MREGRGRRKEVVSKMKRKLCEFCN